MTPANRGDLLILLSTRFATAQMSDTKISHKKRVRPFATRASEMRRRATQRNGKTNEQYVVRGLTPRMHNA